MTNILEESSIESLGDYLAFCEDAYITEFWVGGFLRPFDLPKGQYRWVLFPIDLCPGQYRLCLMLVSKWLIRPISALGMAFAPGEKVLTQRDSSGFGFGFSITPAIASGNTFYAFRNTTNFSTRFNGIHQLGVATSYWSDDVEKTCFEIMLLRKIEKKLIDNI